MILLQIICHRRFLSLLKPQNPSKYLKNLQPNPYRLRSSIFSDSNELLLLSSFNWRPFSFLAQSEPTNLDSKENTTEADKSSPVFLNEDIRLSEKIKFLDIEPERDCEKNADEGKFDSRKRVKVNLWALFTARKMKKEVNLAGPADLGNEDQFIRRRLSSDMKMFGHHLYRKGYFEGASFMPENVFNLTCFEGSYARQFLKFVAVEFGKDHQEIAKWLNAVDLKKVALFGCPNLGYKTVVASKNLRKFFEIEEHKVCENCRIKESCKRANKRAGKGATKLEMVDVVRILVLYSMDSVHWQLARHEEIKNSVSRLLKQVIDLSHTVS